MALSKNQIGNLSNNYSRTFDMWEQLIFISKMFGKVWKGSFSNLQTNMQPQKWN